MSKLIQGVGNFVGYTLSSLDQTSAANDVIVVRHKDGTLHCSPFNVRFGKIKLLRPADKIVTISVNGRKTDACMKMGMDGVAFWLIPTTGDVREDLLSSPLQSPHSDSSSFGRDPNSSPNSPGLSAETSSPESSKAPQMPPPQEAEDVELPPAATATTVVPPLSPGVDETKVLKKYDELLASLNTEKDAGTPPPEAKADSGSGPGSAAAANAMATSTEDGSTTAASLALASDNSDTTNIGGGLRLSKFASSSMEDLVAHHQRMASEMTQTDDFMEGSGSDESLFSESDDEYFEFAEDRADVLEEDRAGGEGEENGEQHQVHYRRSYQPIGADLEKLQLKSGHNTIEFTTNSRLTGTVSVEASIYLWDSNTKIVISDIDGTITKSDVLGQILPKIGKDWTHPGICDLYTQISKNGYEFLYVTARSVSQIVGTKSFVFSVAQKGEMLPKGPLITAPDRLWDALTQEVGKRSHEFKIACLKSVAAAFPKHGQPFYAGFGNRIGDVIAYNAANIPKHKIFIIDHTSAVHVASVRQTYSNLAEMVDHTFPPVDIVVRGVRKTTQDDMLEGEHMDQAFNSFNFWRLPPTSFFAPEESNNATTASNVTMVDAAVLTSPQQTPPQQQASPAASPDPAQQRSGSPSVGDQLTKSPSLPASSSGAGSATLFPKLSDPLGGSGLGSSPGTGPSTPNQAHVDPTADPPLASTPEEGSPTKKASAWRFWSRQ